jgi:hypothetical protein
MSQETETDVETTDATDAADTTDPETGLEAATPVAADADSGSPRDSATTTAPAAPARESGSRSRSASDVSKPADIDIHAELAAKKLLAQQLKGGLISYEDYAERVADHDTNIATAQEAMLEPAKQVQQAAQQQAAARKYWSAWGSGPDVAQVEFGKKVPAAKARALFEQASAEVEANPRYQGRAELDVGTLVYDRWINKLEAEAAGAKTTKAPAAPAPPTRHSGSGGTTNNQASTSSNKTAMQRLEDGDYDFEADARRLKMI